MSTTLTVTAGPTYTLEVGTPSLFIPPASEPADAAIAAGQVAVWLDEGTNTLNFKVGYVDGVSFKSGSIALT